MRSENEIRAKLEDYLDLIHDTPWWEEERELRCMVADALLWVLDDESGAPI